MYRCPVSIVLALERAFFLPLQQSIVPYRAGIQALNPTDQYQLSTQRVPCAVCVRELLPNVPLVVVIVGIHMSCGRSVRRNMLLGDRRRRRRLHSPFPSYLVDVCMGQKTILNL